MTKGKMSVVDMVLHLKTSPTDIAMRNHARREGTGGGLKSLSDDVRKGAGQL